MELEPESSGMDSLSEKLTSFFPESWKPSIGAAFGDSSSSSSSSYSSSYSPSSSIYSFVMGIPALLGFGVFWNWSSTAPLTPAMSWSCSSWCTWSWIAMRLYCLACFFFR